MAFQAWTNVFIGSDYGIFYLDYVFKGWDYGILGFDYSYYKNILVLLLKFWNMAYQHRTTFVYIYVYM